MNKRTIPEFEGTTSKTPDIRILPSVPVVRKAEATLTMANDYWTVVHHAHQGGCPTSLVFRHGTGQNLFVRPLDAHIALKEDGRVNFYRQGFCRNAVLRQRKVAGSVEVSISGKFRSEEGRELPVHYEQNYTYLAWGLVRVRLKMTIEKALNSVFEIGVGSFFLAPSMDIVGLRPGLPPPPPAGHYYSADALLEWYELKQPGSYKQQQFIYKSFIPSYFCAFQKGVEGLEFWRGDDSEPWDRPFGIDPGQAVFLDDTRQRDDTRLIRLEPFCNWSGPRSFGPGAITWEYALGLPFVKERRAARRIIFHAGIASKDWPADDTLTRWADAGVSLVRLHDDDARTQPSWRNCFYPPFDAQNMKRLDHVIAKCHRLGMKILPYFSLKHFHWDCPEFPGNAEQWKQWAGEDGRLPTEGAYGALMCMKSGWLDFKKRSVDIVLRNHAFDGVYYDILLYQFCRHPAHCRGHWHTDADGVFDFMFWTRERVGPKGTIFIHMSGDPGFVFENMADLVFIGEDMSRAKIMPGGHPPDLAFVPIAPRNWVPAGKHFAGESPEARRSFFISMLEGCPVCGTGQSYENLPEFMLSQFAAFKPYDLSRFEFWRSSEKPVLTGHSDVHAALLAGPAEALVYCANLGDQDCRTTLEIDPQRLPWHSRQALRTHVSVPANDAILIRVDENGKC